MRAPAPLKVDLEKAGFFRHRKVGKKVLITNDAGHNLMLTPAQFKRFIEGKVKPKEALHQELRARGFVRDFMDFDKVTKAWKKKNTFLWQGPSLHIIVVTLRCDHRCVYCQTSSVAMDDKKYDMTKETAQKVVDSAFETPSPSLTIEFQGGEPLANWPVVKFIIEYALEKNKDKHKSLWLNLVTYMSFMDYKKLDFLMKNGVYLCTSIDGPLKVHNANRVYTGGNSHANVTKWFKKIRKLTKNKTFGIDALLTTTRLTLQHPEEVVDEYVRLGALGMYLRPLSHYGFAQRTWEKIGYSTQEFLAFYRRAIEYILKLNKKKTKFLEQTARMLSAKIIKQEEPNFLDMRSPCGAGIGQIAYNYDGKVYTCDEGRMLSRMGDDAFLLGDVKKDSFSDFVSHPTVKTLATASCLEGQPECSGCVYLPYCGACPVENYIQQGDLFARTPVSGRCELYKGMLDFLFEKMEDPEVRKIMKLWTRVPASIYQRD